MWSSIMSVIGAIKALIDLFFWFRQLQDNQRKAEAEVRRQEREKAVEDLKNAKTDEEKWDAQDRIVRNKP